MAAPDYAHARDLIAQLRVELGRMILHAPDRDYSALDIHAMGIAAIEQTVRFHEQSNSHPMGRIYRGIAQPGPQGGHLVMIYDDGELVGPLPHRIVRHSPDGFSWGYAGSGPAELALNLLADAIGVDDVPGSLYQRFKFEHVAGWPQDGGWEMSRDDILVWDRAQMTL